MLELKPGIILLLKKDENRFAYRARILCKKYGIKLQIERIPGG
jgi:hypothetical protein